MAITPTNFTLTYNRLNAAPIDTSAIFETTQELVDYLKKDFAFDAGFAPPNSTYPGATAKYHGMFVFDQEANIPYTLKKSATEPDIDADLKVLIEFDINSVPLPAGEEFWFYWEEVGAASGPGAIALSDLYYFNDVEMPNDVGGIPAGTTFDGGPNSLQPADPTLGVDVQTIFNQLFYPYIAPSWSGLSDNIASIVPIGQPISPTDINLTFTVTGTSEDIEPTSGAVAILGDQILGINGNLISTGGEQRFPTLDYPTTGSKTITITPASFDYGADRDRFLNALNRLDGNASVAWAYDGATYPTFNAVTSTRVPRTWRLEGSYIPDRRTDPQTTQSLPTLTTSFNVTPRIYFGVIPSSVLPDANTLISSGEVNTIRANFGLDGAVGDSVILPDGRIQSGFDLISYCASKGSPIKSLITDDKTTDNPAGTYSLSGSEFGAVAGRRVVFVPKIYGIPGTYTYISTSGGQSNLAKVNLQALLPIGTTSADPLTSTENLDYIMVILQNPETAGSIRI